MLVVIAGTGTEVGKTHVAVALAMALHEAGTAVRARKPAQSFEPGDDERGITDAQLLGAATGEDPEIVCPPHRWYPIPLAPPMAAAALARPGFTIGDLATEVMAGGVGANSGGGAGVGGGGSGAARPSVLLVEGAGGVRSPLADDGDLVDLCAVLQPARVVLVADAGLGTINAVRMSVAALDGYDVVVHLKRVEEAGDTGQRNLAWLIDHDGLTVTTTIADLATKITAIQPLPD